MVQQLPGSTMIDDLYKLIGMYLRTVRSQITTLDPKVEQVFVSSNGILLTSSQVSTSVHRTCELEGIATKGRICATILGFHPRDLSPSKPSLTAIVEPHES